MKRKVMILALISLLFLPAMGFTQDVEVSSCYVKWTRRGLDTYLWEAEIRVVNHTDKDYRVTGGVMFYNLSGRAISGGSFSGKVGAGETATLIKRGKLPARYHEYVGDCEAEIRSAYPSRW